MLDEKAQVSIEVLMFIGGAIVIATVAGLYLKSVASQGAGRIVAETEEGIGINQPTPEGVEQP